MTLPTPAPSPIPGGLLDSLHRTWRDRGWDPADLARFRMDAGDGGENGGEGADDLGGLSDDDAVALDALSDDDRDALEALSDEDRQALIDAQTDPRIRRARQEAANRRRELKPWKDLGRELGMTPEQIRAAIKGHKPPKGGEDGKGGNGNGGGEETPDPDEIRREARNEVQRAADRRIVRSEVKVAARDLFADPGDAPLYVDLDKYEVDDDGELLDPEELIEDLKEVLKSKPHLAKKRTRTKPDAGQGRRGEPMSGADAGRAEAERRFGKKKAATAST